jgi:hypothetical protein
LLGSLLTIGAAFSKPRRYPNPLVFLELPFPIMYNLQRNSREKSQGPDMRPRDVKKP